MFNNNGDFKNITKSMVEVAESIIKQDKEVLEETSGMDIYLNHLNAGKEVEVLSESEVEAEVVEEETIEELSDSTLKNYLRKAIDSKKKHTALGAKNKEAAVNHSLEGAFSKNSAADKKDHYDKAEKADKTAKKHFDKADKRDDGITRADRRLAKEDLEQEEPTIEESMDELMIEDDEYGEGSFVGMDDECAIFQFESETVGFDFDMFSEEDMEILKELSNRTVRSYKTKAYTENKPRAADIKKYDADDVESKHGKDAHRKNYNREVGQDRAKARLGESEEYKNLTSTIRNTISEIYGKGELDEQNVAQSKFDGNEQTKKYLDKAEKERLKRTNPGRPVLSLFKKKDK